MQSEEQRLIDGLFGRLKEAETKTDPRDLQAEQQINQHIREQPSAPYYMAQAMIIQEAALKQMDQRVKELEAQVAQLQQTANGQQSSGGFLGGALQTAAGVAGGVVLADMLTGMFRHSQPQEIVNIIEETPAPLDDSAMRNFDASNNLDTFNNGDGGSFLNQDNGFQNVNYQDDTDYADDDYSDDDDSFL